MSINDLPDEKIIAEIRKINAETEKLHQEVIWYTPLKVLAIGTAIFAAAKYLPF